MVYKVIMNFTFRPLKLGEIGIGKIRKLFTSEEINFFLSNQYFETANKYFCETMKKFISLLYNIYFLIKNKELPGSLVIVYKTSHKKKKFLLIKSSHSNAITFPSGSVDFIERPSKTAIRELFEETGLRVNEKELLLLPIVHKFTYKNFPFKIKSQQKVFVLFYKKNNLFFKPQDKHIKWVRWCDEAKTLQLLSYPELKITFKKIISYLKNNDY